MRPRILIADDGRKVVDFVAMSLRTGAYTIVSAMTGRDALRMISRYHPGLVILDLVMPDIDGWQVCEQVRKVS
ncbi:MAG: response regulator [Chloroflexi bacterium]|nr:response regulator [Chloroflexota bacterium]